MATFRVVMKVPATLYAYYDIEADSREELERRLQEQEAVNDIVADVPAVQEISEPDDGAAWRVDEIGVSAQ